MTDSRMYTTPEVRAILGIRARQTLYNWGAEPDERAPGGSGIGLWKRSTIERLADEHRKVPDWEAVTP